MTRAALREMDETRRRWVVRVAVLLGVGLLLVAVYEARRLHRWPCNDQGACDLPPPTHPHVHLAALLALLGIGMLCLAVVLHRQWREPEPTRTRPPCAPSLRGAPCRIGASQTGTLPGTTSSRRTYRLSLRLAPSDER